MLLQDAPLTLQEFVTREDLPLAVVFREVFAILAAREDAVVFGAHAVNAYARVERMTQDVDVLTTHAAELAEFLRSQLGNNLHIALGVRAVVPGLGFRVYQLRDAKNRHLVDVRQTAELPPHVGIEGVRVVELVELVAMKVASVAARKGKEKGISDRLDVHRLLNAVPHLRAPEGEVSERLRLHGRSDLLEIWREVVAEDIVGDDEDD